MDSEDVAVLDSLASAVYIDLASEVIANSALFGAYLLVFVFAFRIYSSKVRRRRTSKILFYLLILSFLLNCWAYGNVCTTILMETRHYFLTQSTGDLDDKIVALNTNVAFKNTFAMLTWPFNINLLLGDAIVAWRAWIIDGRRKVKYILVLLMVGNAGVNIGDAILGSVTPRTPAALDYVSSFISLALNLSAIGVIGWKAWKHGKAKKVFTAAILAGRQRRRSRVEIILLFLVQSGAVFGVIQLVYAVAQTLPGFISGSSLSDQILVFLLGALCNAAAVLYPLAVFIMANTIDEQMVETFHDEADDSPTRANPLVPSALTPHPRTDIELYSMNTSGNRPPLGASMPALN